MKEIRRDVYLYHSQNPFSVSVYIADPAGKHYIIAIAPQDYYLFYESLRMLSKFNPNRDGGFSTEPLEPYHRNRF